MEREVQTGVAWGYLILAGLLEILWATGLKQSESFSKLWPSIGTVLAMIVSFVFLSQAMKSLPLGTAYAVWTGIGAVGTAIVGMILFGESREPVRILCVLAVVGGILGLKLTSKG